MSINTADRSVIDLSAAAAEVLADARASKAGRAGRTLIPGAGAALKQTLLALTTGSVLADHESPGPATLYVMSGRVRLTAGSTDLVLDTGAFAPIPPTRHGLESLEDAVLLLTVAQGSGATTSP